MSLQQQFEEVVGLSKISAMAEANAQSDDELADANAHSALSGAAEAQTARCVRTPAHPFDTGCLPLSYSGNPGVNPRGISQGWSVRAHTCLHSLAPFTVCVCVCRARARAQSRQTQHSFDAENLVDNNDFWVDGCGRQAFPIDTPSKLSVHP
jgi:hypothetical protein